MLWIIRRIKFIFSPKDIRSEFYAYFYPLVFGGGQLSMVITALLAYHYDWKYMYYFMMLLLLVAILAVILFFRQDRPSRPIPWKELHPREMLIISTGLLMLIYVITYGKTLDWMASTRICIYIVIAPLLIALFLWEQFHSSHPFVSLKPLFQWKAIVGYFYMMMVMFFSTSTSLITSYLTTILRVDTTHTYTLYIWLLPGYMLGAFICFWWFRWQRWRFRFLIAGGMACFALFFGMLYFGISPDSTYEMLYLPMFLRGLGMLTLIIAFALFAVEDMPPKLLLSNAFSSFFPLGADAGRRICLLQQHALPPATEIYGRAVRVAHSHRSVGSRPVAIYIKQQSGTRAWHRRSYAAGYKYPLQRIATTGHSAGTEAYSGMAFIVTLVIAIVSRFIPFHKTVRVPVIHTGEDMV